MDAVQFADPPVAAMVEFRRLLAPGSRLVLSCWEAADPADERVSPRIRAVNLRRDLPAASFVHVQMHEKADWRDVERAMWEEADAAPQDSDAAVQSLQAAFGLNSRSGLHTARDADRIAVMDAGRITELGAHHKLTTANGAYAALWQAWKGNASDEER